jgi:transposase InsO family protein
LHDESRRPHHSPRRVSAETERLIIELRDRHPYWGARKLRRVLSNQGHVMPAISTVHAIVQRHGRVPPSAAEIQRPMCRFERERPNELWQMDFKGDFRLGRGGRCYPLTILDDHSRFSPCVHACCNQRHDGVQQALTRTFERYGLPECILADHGPPWGDDRDSPHTRLTIWLLRMDVRVIHGRPYHPQTQGKEERFNRTLKDEVLRGRPPLSDQAAAQAAFDDFRERYNFERPHESLDDAPPITRYRPSERLMPSKLLPPDYPEGVAVRRVQSARIAFQGARWRLGKPFEGQLVGLRPAAEDGLWKVYLDRHPVAVLDLREKRLEHVLQ